MNCPFDLRSTERFCVLGWAQLYMSVASCWVYKSRLEEDDLGRDGSAFKPQTLKILDLRALIPEGMDDSVVI